MGNLIYGVIGLVVCLLISKDKVASGIGFLSGVLLACFMVWHMNRALWLGLNETEDGALKEMRKSILLRVLVLIVVFLALFFSRKADLVAALFGLFSLKVSAYLQPVLHKVIRYPKRRKRV